MNIEHVHHSHFYTANRPILLNTQIPYLSELFLTQNPKNIGPYSSNYVENATPLRHILISQLLGSAPSPGWGGGGGGLDYVYTSSSARNSFHNDVKQITDPSRS